MVPYHRPSFHLVPTTLAPVDVDIELIFSTLHIDLLASTATAATLSAVIYGNPPCMVVFAYYTNVVACVACSAITGAMALAWFGPNWAFAYPV